MWCPQGVSSMRPDNTKIYIRACLEALNRAHEPNLIAAFRAATTVHRETPAFRCLGRTLTFAEVGDLTRDFAAFLIGVRGLEKGDRIAIQLPNTLQYPIAAWAALRAGLVVVNTNPLYTERELRHQFSDSGARALVVAGDVLGMIENVIPDTDIGTVIATGPDDFTAGQQRPASASGSIVSFGDALVQGHGLNMPAVEPDLDDLAVLQYTGGTTGVPKGAMLTHGNVLAAAVMSQLSFGAERVRREIGIAPMPLYHIYGFEVNLIAGFLNGSLSILVPNPRDLDGLIDVMKQETFTAFAGVNTLFASLLRHPDFDAIDFSQMDKTISGGTATVEEIAAEWERRTGCPVYEGYGLSEVAAMATVNTPDKRRLGTIGPAMTGTELKVVDASGKTLPPGEEGELSIRGPQVMQGYWGRPEATREVLDADGWFRTGDIAVIQPDGLVRIVDRLKDMILVSGFNVYPNEIESVVYGHPDVIECAAIGEPDDKTGETVKLFVVTSNPQLDTDDVRAFCRQRLAAYKVPKHVEVRDELPKSNVGKILRRELRE